MRWRLALLALSALGQEFEVASIRPPSRPRSTPSGGARSGSKSTGARAQFNGYSLGALLSYAFGVPGRQIAGRDLNVFFNIAATLPEGATREQVPAMMQALLAERFKLACHREQREYDITFLRWGRTA